MPKEDYRSHWNVVLPKNAADNLGGEKDKRTRAYFIGWVSGRREYILSVDMA